MKRAAMFDSTESYAPSLGGSVRCRTLPIETAPARFTATIFHQGRVLLVPDVPGTAFCCRKFPWLQLIAHRNLVMTSARRIVEDFRLWVVSEFTTGTIVHTAGDDSQEAAVQHCLSALKRTNGGLLVKNIRRLIRETGRGQWAVR
jgi:hypothetical protein